MFFVVFGGCFYPFGGPISCWCAKNGDGADMEDTSRKTRMGVLFQQPDFAVVLFSAGMERDAGKIADGHFLGDGFHDGMGLAERIKVFPEGFGKIIHHIVGHGSIGEEKHLDGRGLDGFGLPVIGSRRNGEFGIPRILRLYLGDQLVVHAHELAVGGGAHFRDGGGGHPGHDPYAVKLLVAHQVDGFGEAHEMGFDVVGILEPRFGEVDAGFHFGRTARRARRETFALEATPLSARATTWFGL